MAGFEEWLGKSRGGGVEEGVEAMRRFRCVQGVWGDRGAGCVGEGEVGVSGCSWRCSWDSLSVQATGFGKVCFGLQGWNRDAGDGGASGQGGKEGMKAGMDG